MAQQETRTAFLPVITGWAAWEEVFLNVEQWRPVVERVCHKIGVAGAYQVEAGYPGTCAVFVVNRQVVIKFYPPMLPHDFHKEREAYHLLDGRLHRLPRLCAGGIYHDQIDWPYLAIAYCPGEPIRNLYARLDDENLQCIGAMLGTMIRTIHDTPLQNVSAFDTRVSTWQAFLQRRQQECLAALPQETELSLNLIDAISLFLEETVLSLTQDTQLHLLHADLTEDHLLLRYDGDQWHISALLDWADAEVGTLDYEWVALWFGLCQRNPTLLRAILKEYDSGLSIDAEFCRRMMAYTLLHRFGPAIINHLWHADGEPAILTVKELQEWLWPLF